MATLLLRRVLRTSFKGFLIPVSSFIAFTTLLSFIFILYKPSAGPTKVQKVGWQEWDLVSLKNGVAQQPETTSPNKAPPQTDVDWWDVGDDKTNSQSSTSLPLDQWNPLLPHDTGISEIGLTRCLIDPGLGLCFPGANAEPDSVKGKWTMVEQDLNLKSGLYYLNLYYRRTRRLDVPLITDLLLLPKDEAPPEANGGWAQVSLSIRDGVPGQAPLYLWYKQGPPRSQLNDTQAANLITEIMVHRGDGRTWYGFDKLSTPVSVGKKGMTENVYLSYRRGVKTPPRAPPLHFSRDGQFKILQIADLHFSVDHGVCRDTLQDCGNADDLTLALMGQTLDLEKPDMVVFTGDQLNGQGTSWDPRAVMAKFAGPVIDRKIPWAAVFGNHDEEGTGMERAKQVKWLQAMPYSLVEPGPSDVHGSGNYVLAVRSADASKTQLLTLYFLDSGAYSEGFWSWFGFIATEYDWIHENQISWFLDQSSRVPMIQRPWNPDGGKDLSAVWTKRGGKSRQATENRTIAKPNAMMFYHIPIEETYSTADVDVKSGKPLDIGEQMDQKATPKKNSGMFDNGLMKAHENELGGREVKIVANGHCHTTDNCRRVKGTWFCFNGGSSYSGYGKAGFDRRFRVFHVEQYGEKITTWKRTEHSEKIDEMVLVGEGGPAPYEG